MLSLNLGAFLLSFCVFCIARPFSLLHIEAELGCFALLTDGGSYTLILLSSDVELSGLGRLGGSGWILTQRRKEALRKRYDWTNDSAAVTENVT